MDIDRRHLLLSAVVALGFAPPAGAHSSPAFAPVDRWAADRRDALVRRIPEREAINLGRGTIRSGPIYTDFVFRFQYRLTSLDADPSLLVRAQFEYNKPPRAYQIPLSGKTDGRDAFGRARGDKQALREVRYVPPSMLQEVGRWIAGEVRAERDRLTVSLDGAVVSESDRLDEFGGHLGFRVDGAGGIELRGLELAPLPVAREPFGAGAIPVKTPGVAMPRMTQRAAPNFPRGPFDERRTGVVKLDAIVETDGRIGDLRVTDSPDPDFSQAAIACARKFGFAPARRDGMPIAVFVTLEVAFNLR